MTPTITLHRYRVIFQDDAKLSNGEPCVIAEHPDLPGCIAYGANRVEAETLLAEARELFLKSMIEAGEEIPPPTVNTVTWVSGAALGGGGADLSDYVLDPRQMMVACSR